LSIHVSEKNTACGKNTVPNSAAVSETADSRYAVINETLDGNSGTTEPGRCNDTMEDGTA
jgi:hypothetical protein